MVIRFLALMLVLATGIGLGFEPTSALAKVDGAADRVRSALSEEGYPWYDAEQDAPQPVPLPFDWWEWLEQRLRGRGLGNSARFDPGQIVVYLLMGAALAALVILLVQALRRYGGFGATPTDLAGQAVGTEARIGRLPDDVRPGSDDPWADAVRRRRRGDYAGAIVALFAHLLLRLDRLGLVHLTRDRTGRQLVRAIEAAEVRARVEPTLRLFEAACYGHRVPSPEAFENAWAEAEALERLISDCERATP